MSKASAKVLFASWPMLVVLFFASFLCLRLALDGLGKEMWCLEKYGPVYWHLRCVALSSLGGILLLRALRGLILKVGKGRR